MIVRITANAVRIVYSAEVGLEVDFVVFRGFATHYWVGEALVFPRGSYFGFPIKSVGYEKWVFFEGLELPLEEVENRHFGSGRGQKGQKQVIFDGFGKMAFFGSG